MRRLHAWVAVTIALSSCAFGRHQARTPFVCQGRVTPAVWPVVHASTLPVGRFELKVLDPPVATDLSKKYPDAVHLKRRIQVVADAVLLGTFAVRLSEALGLVIAVEDSLVDLRITVSALGLPLEDLLQLLESTNPLHALWRQDGLLLMSPKGVWDLRRRSIQVEDLMVHVLPLWDESRAAQLAALVCDQLVSDRGSVAVVGSSLVVRAPASQMGKVAQLLRVLDPPPGDTADGGQ